MARYKRMEVLNVMLDIGLIPVFFNADVETAKKRVIAEVLKYTKASKYLV